MDPSQVIIRPVVSEKSYVLAANDKYTFRVHPDAHKTQIRQAVEALFDVKVVEVRTLLGQVQAQAPRAHRRAHARVEEGDRAGAPGRHDPDLPGPAGPRGLSSMADSQAQAHEPRSPLRRPTRTSPRSRRPSPRSRSSRASRSPAGATPTAARPRATAAAAPSACTARSTSSAARTACRRRSPRSSTTPTARPTSRCCTTSTARRRYILAPARLTVGMTVQSGPGRRDPASATACRWPTCRPAPWSTTSSCSPAAAASSAARPAPAIQLMAKEGDMATLRLPSGEMRLVRAECRATVGVDRQRRSPERQDRQGRPQAPHGRAPADARHGDEPGRPPARRRRGLDDRRPPSRSRRGACRRSATARARRTSRPTATSSAAAAAAREGLEVEHVSRSSKKGPWVEERLMARIEAMNAANKKTDGQDLVARLDDLPRDGRAHDRRPRRPQARARVRSESMVGHKLGEFAPTRTYRGHADTGKVR